MWLSLDTDLRYRFEGDISPVAFFEHLLLAPTDTLVLGCYDARADIRSWLAVVSIAPAWQDSDTTETRDINRREYPHGTAFHLRPDSSNLKQLQEFAECVAESIELCGHLAAYSFERPLLIYHGAFRESLFLSTCIPRDRVEAFSAGIATPFEVIDFHETYSSSTSIPK